MARAAPRTSRSLLASLGLQLTLGCAPPDAATPPAAWITIRGERIAVEVASSPAQQQLGLGQRDSLDWNQGMLFVYEEPGFYGFWMQDMRFDIDIVWIRGGRIVDITARVPHRVTDPLPIYRPRELCDTVLEVPAGAAQARGWRIGESVGIERSPPR